jgi:hypothetical protein
VTSADPRQIAERLGLPQEAVRSIQRRGFLWRLDFGESEIRERLWRGHAAFLASRTRGRAAAKRGGAGRQMER